MRMDTEDEALFRSYPYALYFVQSPSTVLSHSNTDLRHTAELSPPNSPRRPENHSTANPAHDTPRFALSRCSSSRGSNNSFLHEKKIAYDAHSRGTAGTESGENRLIVRVDRHDHIGCGDEYEEEEEEEEYYGRELGWWWWWRYYLSFGASPSLAWICLQVMWRVLVSLGVALVVFYIATKPPPPKMFVKIAGIGQFVLGEGVDGSGVATKVLTCNCSIDLLVENKSKLFGLHLHPPSIEMSFETLPLASSTCKIVQVNLTCLSFALISMYENKPLITLRPRDMLIGNGKGLPLALHLSFRSNFRVVWGLFKPRFHHRAECSLVLDRAYDKKHHTQAYSSSCIMIAT
ncbi:hypothetical protein RHSIM_Rhsim07G0055500 [Rhododendron simsii]|uniref:Late embryogenesis abundant protein LEA-2 subgroup domain-containing protein n=1 Tax=Rhododendron simsii TaxID=118357 RepID=A0A834LJL0_RHOSS|nr:hypothetical protein RHSIM_Rhsim07G0055500 [Rhododendron simsii]